MAAAPSGAQLVYYGGRVISNVQVIEVLYGSGSYLSQIAGSLSPNMATFFQGVLNSPYVDWLSEFNTSGGAQPDQVIGRGSFLQRVGIAPAASRNQAIVSDDDIQAELVAQIAAGALPGPTLDAAGNSNTYYAVFFPHGKTIMLGDSASCTVGSFCAYHNTIAQGPGHGEVYYGVHPDMQAGSGCEFGCGVGSLFAKEQQIAAHELVEAITDPEIGLASALAPPLAWYDQSFGEIGDICNGLVGTVVGSDGVTYAVQKEFSNRANDCIVVTPAPLASAPASTPRTVFLLAAGLLLLGALRIRRAIPAPRDAEGYGSPRRYA
jgi:hypothetical protein